MVVPSGIVSTAWPSVRDKSAQLGITYDPWQHGAGRLILAKRENGKYATSVGGVVISIPRQVGKTFLVGGVVTSLCLLNEGQTFLWTAHRLRTAAETFNSMQAMVRRKKVAPHVKRVVLGSGDEAIEFVNGSRILFGARERGFGRGFADVAGIVFDEAQILTENAIDDMVPATSVSPNPLLLYTGTPPKPGDPSDVFSMRRTEALAGKTDDTLYIEFSADSDADPLDREQWAKANPSYPHRTPAESMLRMKRNLKPESFMREALGVWDDEQNMGVFSPGAWLNCGTTKKPPKPAALGIALDADRVWLSLGACSDFPKPHLGAVKRVRLDVDRAKLLAQLAEIANRLDIPVALDARGPASSLVEEIEDLGVTVLRAGLEDYIKACADLYDAVEVRAITHGHYDDLDAAVAAAGWRRVMDRRVWSRKSGDVSMLEAVTLAMWGAQTSTYDVDDSYL